MTKEQADYLKDCNGFIRQGEHWLPSIRTSSGDFKTPSGLKCPKREYEWRAASHEQIVAEMDSRNEVPIWNFGR